jgi:hypothetical protein
MQRRAAAFTVALALLSIPMASPAGKPIRSLPRPSASRSAGPESLAHATRRQRTRLAAAHPPKRVHSRITNRKQRVESARAEHNPPREVRVRQRRADKRSHTPDRQSSRKALAANKQTARRNRRGSTTTAARIPARRLRPEENDEDASTNSPRQAFSSISPLKSIEQEASTPVLLPSLRLDSLYDSRGRLNVPAPLYGSHEILVHQNEMADREGLDRIRDNSDLEDLLRQKKLVALPAGGTLQVDDRLPADRRYSRPWTAAFLSVLARDYYANFHQPIYVTSAVRTVQVQQRLVRTNGNAAPVSGDNASPHLTGQAVDIAKKGLSMAQIAWLRTYLQSLIGDGKIDVEEEFRQSCFHVSVYRSYLPTAPKLSIASTREQADSTRP